MFYYKISNNYYIIKKRKCADLVIVVIQDIIRVILVPLILIYIQSMNKWILMKVEIQREPSMKLQSNLYIKGTGGTPKMCPL